MIYLPKNYLKANSLYLMSKGYTEVPIELKECVKLRALNLRDNPLKGLPLWLKDLPLLSTLIIGHESQVPIPDWLGEMQQLEELTISYNELKEVPPCIAQLKNLKKLNLRVNQLDQLPAFLFELPLLQELNIGENQITAIPEQIGQLQQLRQLRIQHNPITHRLPNSMAQLKRLEQIYWTGVPIQQLPSSILFLPNLNPYTFLDGNRNEELERLIKRFRKLKPIISPEEILGLMPYLEFSNESLYGRHPKAKHPIILNKRFTNFFHRTHKQTISPEDRQTLFQLIIQHEDIQELSRAELYRLYNIPIAISQAAIIKQLPNSFPTLADKELNEKAQLSLKGEFAEPASIHLKLDAGIIPYQINEIGAETTHVLISTENVKLKVDEQRLDLVFINQSQLQDYWNSVEMPYLLDKTEVDAESMVQIRELLTHKEDQNVLLGLQMLEGLGLPDELVTYVFCNYKISPNRYIQQQTKWLLQHFGSEKLRANLEMELSLAAWGMKGKEVESRVQYWVEIADLDAFAIYYYLYKKDKLTVDYLFNYEGGEEQIVRDALIDLVKGDELVIEHFTHLKKLPHFVYELKEIGGLKLNRSEMTSLPDGISQWTQLKSIVLTSNSKMFELPSDFTQLHNLEQFVIEGSALHQLPEDIGTLTKLKKVILYVCYQLKIIPDSFFQLPQLETLHLKNTGITTPIYQIEQLQTLKELVLKEFRFDIIPFQQIYNLKKLEELVISDIYKKRNEIPEYIPDGIAQLTRLNSLAFFNSPINQLPTDLGELQHLEKLEIANCHQLETLPDSLGELSQLNYFRLYADKIDRFPLQIYQLKKLETLDLDHSQLRELPDGIGALQQLKILKLRNNHLTKLPEDIGLLQQLKELDISHANNLRTIPKSMYQLQQLRLIKARGLSQKIVHRLKKNLPNCNVDIMA